MNQKTTFVSLCCLFVVAMSQSICAQIYTNGPISTGATSTNSTAAPAGYTWSELQSPNTSLGMSGFYNTALTNDFALADEFVVPATDSWTITSIDFFGYQTSYVGTTIPIDVLRVRIWNGDPSLATSTVVFGNMTTNVLNAAASSEAFVYRAATSSIGTTRKIWKYRANVSTTLVPGTYWVEFQAHAINDASLFFPPVTILNTLSSATWNGKQRSAAAWINVTDGGSTNTLAVPFNINGTTLETKNFEFSSQISIFPNPANTSITIKDSSNSINAFVEIIDVTGRIVKSTKSNLDAQISLDISNLLSGNYILKLNSENGSAIKKFIKL